MVTVGKGLWALPVNHSEQLPDSISTCDVNRGYYMLLLFLFALLLFFVDFFRNSNIISIGTVEFRYYVVIIIPVNLGKPEAIRD